MSKSIRLLTKGLVEGYTGKTTIESITRGGFGFKRSHYEGPEGSYHDEWISARIGGGQEVTDQYTRVYAGGVIDFQLLSLLGITEKEVIAYLMKKVNKLGDKTRLFEDCHPEADDHWQYDYHITDRITSIDLTRAIETITFRGKQVFVHGFEICPIKK